MRNLILVLVACLVLASLEAYDLGPNLGFWEQNPLFGPWGGDSKSHHELPYDGLRVTYGSSDKEVDSAYFFKIPRTMNEAVQAGWRLTNRPSGPMRFLRMFCPPGRGVCPLYDDAGLVAGLQLALPVEDYVFKQPEKKFVLWHAPAAGGEPARDYWTITQYYVHEDSFDTEMGYQSGFETLREGGVWVSGPDGKLLKIPIEEAELNSTSYTKQQCLPKMGNHYYWKMNPNLKCEELFPWFPLTIKNQLIGVGFIMFGRLAPQRPRHYFEVPPSKDRFSKSIIPDAPECLTKWERQYGLISMHIYYVNDPWNIRCDKDTGAM